MKQRGSVPAGLGALRVLAGLHLSETADGERGEPTPPAGPPGPVPALPLQPLPPPRQAGPPGWLQPLCLLCGRVDAELRVRWGDLRRLGVHPSALSPPGQCSPEGETAACYSFSPPQPAVSGRHVLCLGAGRAGGGRAGRLLVARRGCGGNCCQGGKAEEDPSLTHVGCFLFGLYSERRAMELERHGIWYQQRSSGSS